MIQISRVGVDKLLIRINAEIDKYQLSITRAEYRAQDRHKQ